MYGFPCTDLHLSVHGLKSSCTDVRIPNSVHFCEFPKKNPYIRTSVHTVSPEYRYDITMSEAEVEVAGHVRAHGWLTTEVC